MASKMRASGRKRAMGRNKAAAKLELRRKSHPQNDPAYKMPGQLNKH